MNQSTERNPTVKLIVKTFVNKGNNKVLETSEVMQYKIDDLGDQFIDQMYQLNLSCSPGTFGVNLDRSRTKGMLTSMNKYIDENFEKIEHTDVMDIAKKQFKWNIVKADGVKEWIITVVESLNTNKKTKDKDNKKYLILGMISVCDIIVDTYSLIDEIARTKEELGNLSKKFKLSLGNVCVNTKFVDINVFNELLDYATTIAMSYNLTPNVLVSTGQEKDFQNYGFKTIKDIDSKYSFMLYNDK